MHIWLHLILSDQQYLYNLYFAHRLTVMNQTHWDLQMIEFHLINHCISLTIPSVIKDRVLCPVQQPGHFGTCPQHLLLVGVPTPTI